MTTPTKLYAPEFRSAEIRECESFRDYLHGDTTFVAYLSQEAALAAAHDQLESDVEGRDPDEGKVTIDKWERCPEGEATPYSDGGVWYELSDGEEGRVVIHTILLG